MEVNSQRLNAVRAAVLGALLLGVATAQAASSVLIWPIDPVLEADQQASALWLENRGTETASLQIRVFAWSQSGFSDQYQNQRDVIGSPPVAKIEPGQKQLVRLTRTKDVPPGTVYGGNPAVFICTTEQLIQRVEARCEAYPWIDLVKQRNGAYDPEVEPLLMAQRRQYFFGDGKNG